MQNRRQFLKTSIACSAFISLEGYRFNAFETSKLKRITILHTNDTHSQINALPNNHSTHPNLGGFIRRANIIEQVKKENPNTLLLDSGDIIQGSTYFNPHGSELEFKLMSTLGYDLATFGNHDFDIGLEQLNRIIPKVNFDFVVANYDFKNTVLENKVKPYKTFQKDGVKIGVFGLGIQLKGLSHSKLYQETIYLDPISVTQDTVRGLKALHHCDIIICLSHLGHQYENYPHQICDLQLAQQTKDIDLIIGAHTHTLLHKPEIVKNKVNETVLINQCGKNGVFMGQIDFYIDTNGKKIAEGKSIVV